MTKDNPYYALYKKVQKECSFLSNANKEQIVITEYSRQLIQLFKEGKLNDQ